MRKFRKAIAIIIACIMTISVMSIPANAANPYDITNKYGFFRNLSSNKLLYFSSASNGTTPSIEWYSAVNGFMWRVTSADSGYYYIECASNSSYVLCMDSNNAIKIYSKTSTTVTTNQKQWTITAASNGTYEIKSRSATRYLVGGSSLGTDSYSSIGTAWIFEPSTDQSSTVNSTYDKFAPPISSVGTTRSAQYTGHTGIDIGCSSTSRYVYSTDTGFAVYKQNIGTYITTTNISGGTAIDRSTLDNYYKIIGGKVG